MKTRTILLVEDDANDLELTLSALEEVQLANEVAVARDGAEALDYLFRRGEFADRPEETPLLVLLDVKMPRVDGIEVLRQVKQHPALRLIPVVMLTSSREEPDLIECYRLGANAYVVKPVDFEQFVDVVKQLSLFWVSINEPAPRGEGGA